MCCARKCCQGACPRTHVFKCFADILEEAGVVDWTVDREVDKYLSESLISFHGSNSFS